MQKYVEQQLTEKIWETQNKYVELSEKYVSVLTENIKLKEELNHYKQNTIHIVTENGIGTVTADELAQVKNRSTCFGGHTFNNQDKCLYCPATRQT
jgi:hypothetical protein